MLALARRAGERGFTLNDAVLELQLDAAGKSLKPALIERAATALEQLALATADGGPAMLVGSVFVRDGNLHNGVALLDGGKVAATRFKRELPNYGTFDEVQKTPEYNNLFKQLSL